MFKLYSRGCQHALRALSYAVHEHRGRRFQAKDICQRADIPEHFTRKVLQTLVQIGFLDAHRGSGGGYCLKGDPEKISALEVIRAVEGATASEECVMGFPECGEGRPCPLHSVWMDTKRRLLRKLSRTTLREIADSTIEPKEG